ncbi:FAD-dependent oxidoreductase [Acuticoccus sp.]|uniref:FAD-dependent oxidoreductase n=1 Tax=Acuticoccus sp. TaxID=1904378 RepID=UPI003B516F87
MSRREVDVVVLGAGAAGMCAALVCAVEGLSVLLLEKELQVGGTTAWSGGMVWAPMTDVARRAGYTDDAADVQRYLDALVPRTADRQRLEAFLAAAPEAIAYLTARTAVVLQPVARYPDYYTDLPGATEAGRVLEPVPLDATLLGPHLALLRRPLPEFALFGDMMVARADLPHFRNGLAAPRSTFVVASRLARYAWQKARHGRGTTLVLGNALAGRLLLSLVRAGVSLETGAEVDELLWDGEAVAGVRTVTGEVGARRGVVLATGGFTHDAGRRRVLLPARAEASATASGASGDGARLAEACGARFAEAAEGNAFWAPVSRYRRPDGSEAVYPHTVTDRAKPGLIAVDDRGERFVNEAVSYHEFVRAMLAHDNAGGAWLLGDARFLQRYGLGAAKPMAPSLRHFLDQRYLVRRGTVRELAVALGLPADALVRTVDRTNAAAARGEDPEFGRGSTAYQRFLGDADVTPNPCVAPLVRPPFYAVRVAPGDLGAAAGLMTDASARVLSQDGRPIAGLYACGADALSVMEGSYPGPGITLGPALTFGYLAARDLSRTVPERAGRA